MMKKFQRFFYAGIFFLIFLCVGFFYLSTNKSFAAGLEVEYPTIAGQSLGADTTLPKYILYLFNAGVFLGFFAVFISLTIAGAMYLLSPVSAEARADAKDRVSGAISGLLILALIYLIITTINPQLSFLTMNSLPPSPQPAATPPAPGVYFYKSGCSDASVQPSTSSKSDLGLLKNKINSVKIQQDTVNKSPYISILYNNPDFWGKCLYIASAENCKTVESFASSASIYKYDPNPNGDGVYFYRKSYFNNKGGWLKISNSEIINPGSKKVYAGDLDQLKFTGQVNGECNVSEEERDCVKYDDNEKCTQRVCPTLAGENISSVKIKGDYIVLFVYAGLRDSSSGPWTSCQEFPTTEDVNKTGPLQIKWENIRNGIGVVPNYVVIIPIQP